MSFCKRPHGSWGAFVAVMTTRPTFSFAPVQASSGVTYYRSRLSNFANRCWRLSQNTGKHLSKESDGLGSQKGCPIIEACRHMVAV